MIFRDNKYWHEGKTANFCRLYYKNYPIHLVEVTPDETENPEYWAWWDNKREQFINIWPSESQVGMCFAYGTEVVEQRGEDKLMGVKIIKLSEAE